MRRGSRPEARQPRWPPVPEWAVAASAAAATAGGRPGNPAGREKKSTSHGVARRIARRLVDMCRAAMIGWLYHVGGRCELTRY